MGGMENERENQGGAGAATCSIGTVLVVLLILYAASSGPMWWFCKGRFGLTDRTWDMVYMPLHTVDYWVPPLGQLHMAYVNWWHWLA